MECERCKKENQQVKAGKTKSGSQRYKCKHCGKVYTPKQKGMRYDKEIKKQAIKLYMEGNSGRAVGRILGIGKNMCLYWVKKYAKEIELENAANEREKNRFYVITLVSSEKRQIVGYDIAYEKSSERIQRLLDKSPKAEQYYSDVYSAYSEV